MKTVCKPKMFEFDDYPPFNLTHIVRYRATKARLVSWDYSKRIETFPINNWFRSLVNLEPKKPKRQYSFIPPCIEIWFSNNDYPVKYNFSSYEKLWREYQRLTDALS